MPGRLQDAARRPKTAPSWSPEARESAQDAARSEEKKAQKRSEAQSPPDLVFRRFLGGCWSVFGWIWEGFWDDFGSLEVDFSRILGASPKPQETTRGEVVRLDATLRRVVSSIPMQDRSTL